VTARAPTREGAFDDLVLRPAQRQLLQLSQTILARRDSSTFLPLLIATRVRYPSDGLAYLEMVNAVGEVLAVPRLLSERDHRIVRWLAVQVLRFWLTVYEAARHLRERLVTLHSTADVSRWREMMNRAAAGASAGSRA
jgi:hypothetical protein